MTDAAVRERMRQAQRNVVDCQVSVEHVQGRLHQRMTAARARLVEIQDERQTHLTGDTGDAG